MFLVSVDTIGLFGSREQLRSVSRSASNNNNEKEDSIEILATVSVGLQQFQVGVNFWLIIY